MYIFFFGFTCYKTFYLKRQELINFLRKNKISIVLKLYENEVHLNINNNNNNKLIGI